MVQAFSPPSEAQLIEKREVHLKQNKPGLHQDLKKHRELTAHLKAKARAVKEYAESLGGGPEAWDQAIREQLLD